MAFVNLANEPEILKECASIQKLAMKNHRLLHIFVWWHAHTAEFEVEGYELRADYLTKNKHEPIIREGIWLTDKAALSELKALKSKLTDLIKKAKAQREEMEKCEA